MRSVDGSVKFTDITGKSDAQDDDRTHNWGKKWTIEEDEKLIQGIETFGNHDWTKVSELVGTRNRVQCKNRWLKVLSPSLIKGKWSEEEDHRLKLLVCHKFEHWGKIAENMPGRTAKQCKERWNNYLDPSIIRAPFTAEEDQMILRFQAVIGNKWARIAKELPGRTDNSVKLRYLSLIKRNPNIDVSPLEEDYKRFSDIVEIPPTLAVKRKASGDEDEDEGDESATTHVNKKLSSALSVQNGLPPAPDNGIHGAATMSAAEAVNYWYRNGPVAHANAMLPPANENADNLTVSAVAALHNYLDDELKRLQYFYSMNGAINPYSSVVPNAIPPSLAYSVQHHPYSQFLFQNFSNLQNTRK